MNNINYNEIIINYLKENDDIFNNILSKNNDFMNLININIDNFINRKVTKNWKWKTKTFWTCIDVSNWLIDILSNYKHPRIIWIWILQWIIYDAEKMDDGYVIDSYDWEIMYTQHSAVELFIWNSNYTEIIKYPIDLTVNQFYLKTIDNEKFINDLLNEKYNIIDELFILWSWLVNYLVDDDFETQIELEDRWYEPEYSYYEWYFSKLMKKYYQFPNDIFPNELIERNEYISNYIMNNYPWDHIIRLFNDKFEMIYIEDIDADINNKDKEENYDEYRQIYFYYSIYYKLIHIDKYDTIKNEFNLY